MSEINGNIGGEKPRRAEPLQPDAPTSGNDAERDPKTRAEHDREEFEASAKKQEEQSDTALSNVRDGYK